MTDWFVYRCETHRRTTYVNAYATEPFAVCPDECDNVTLTAIVSLPDIFATRKVQK